MAWLGMALFPLPVLAGLEPRSVAEASPPNVPAAPTVIADWLSSQVDLVAALPPSLPESVGPVSEEPASPVIMPPELEPGYPLFPELPPRPPRGAPPRLLTPGTPPDRRHFSLIPAPAIATGTPIPGKAAGNCVRRDARGRFMGWMDRQHCVYSGRALVTARWVDDFFGDWYDDEASMEARLVYHTAVTESVGLDSKLTLRASAMLPNARRRVRLIVTDETEEGLEGQEVQRQLGQDDSRVSAALSWTSLETPTLRSRLDVGVRGIDPMDLFLRYRLNKTWSLTEDALVRTTHTLRYGSDSKERYTPTLDVERALDENSVLRFSNYYDYRHETKGEGFNWTHSLSLSHTLGNRRSMAYGIALHGPTRPEWRGESFGPWIIYRRPFLRPWLYAEVEPHYSWARERDWDGRASMLLRLEMQFGYRR